MESTEVYRLAVMTGHDSILKPQKDENDFSHDWSLYVKGAQGTK